MQLFDSTTIVTNLATVAERAGLWSSDSDQSDGEKVVSVLTHGEAVANREKKQKQCAHAWGRGWGQID